MDTKDNSNTKQPRNKRLIAFWILIVLYIIYVIAITNFYFFRAPKESKETIIHISSGQTVSGISLELKEKNIIRHSDLLKFLIKVFNDNNKIDIGDYKFEKDSSAWKIAWQISKGVHNIKPIKITLREGLTNEEMATILESKLSNFNKNNFLNREIAKQGYLFPDTYFFYPLTTTDEILEALTSNFENRIKKLNNDINESGRSLSNIITMASIIEKEASGKDDARIISGILWKRIEKGMPLQADASPITYREKGLPTEPICNPGLSSIEASISPVASPYLFYLHDKDGNVHFAVTYEEHKQNIKKYLK